jgi:hypothetical protein
MTELATMATSTELTFVNAAAVGNFAAAVAVLVADGATPTQAHVNTLNAAWRVLAPRLFGISDGHPGRH